MLERAKACLQSGARESLRSKPRTRPSRRALHSAFWSHGASNLDLPPSWAVSDPPPATVCRDGNLAQERASAHDTPFLDFLYPPQALALLHRTGRGGHQWERWEGRNARRLPEGFVQASRGYASRSGGESVFVDHDPRPEDERQERESLANPSTPTRRERIQNPADGQRDGREDGTRNRSYDLQPGQNVPLSKETLDTIAELDRSEIPGDGQSAELAGGNERSESWTPNRVDHAVYRPLQDRSKSSLPNHDGQTVYRPLRYNDAALSTGDLAEQERYDDQFGSAANSAMAFSETTGNADASPYDRLQRLQRIMATPSILRSRGEDPNNQKSHHLVDRVLQMYLELPYDIRDGIRLKLALLEWLAPFHYNPAEERCLVLYESLPHAEKPLSAYSAAMAVCMRRGSLSTLASVYQEAVNQLPNGHQLAREYFKFAVLHEHWDLALGIEMGLGESHNGSPGVHQAVLWVELSNIPGLLPRAFKLIERHRNPLARTSGVKSFCARFCREALVQEFNAEGSAGLPSSLQAASMSEASERKTLRKTMEWLHYLPATDAVKAYNSLLDAMLRDDARFDFPLIYWAASWLYHRARDLDSYRMPERTFTLFFSRLIDHLAIAESPGGSRTSVSIEKLNSDWIRDHGKLAWHALVRTMKYYAQTARPIEVATWLKYLQSTYPGYDGIEEVIGFTIRAHAQKADVEGAKRAFEAARLLASQNHRALPVSCWNALLYAYSRIDNISGCLSTLQSMVDQEVKPNEASFLTILVVLGRMGDVRATRDLMRQYEDLTGEKPPVHFHASLISAHMKRREIAEAERILHEVYEDVSSQRIRGSMSWPCNTILMAYAARRDLDSTIRVYQWMRSHKISADQRTFAALMQALAHHGRTNAAWKLLRVAMPEQKLRPSAMHYAIVMRGFLHQGMLEEALMVHSHMKTQNIKSAPATNAVYLQIKARYEGEVRAAPEDIRTRGGLRARLMNRGSRDGSQSSPSAALLESVEDMKRMLRRLDGSGLAASEGHILEPDGSSDTSSAAMFGHLIYVHGKRGCFSAVHELYAQYRKQQTFPSQAADPAVIVYALMDALLNAGEYGEVEKYWLLAKEQADEAAAEAANLTIPDFTKKRPGRHVHQEAAISDVASIGFNPLPAGSAADLSQPLPTSANLLRNKALPSEKPGLASTLPPLNPTPEETVKYRPAIGKSRFLSAPLRLYIQALCGQNRMLDAITTFSSTLNQGYQLDIRTWNTFIEKLCRASPPLTLLAYVLTEKYLVPQFPGWITSTTQARPGFLARKQNLQYIRARFLPPELLMPQYSTLVYLGFAVLQLRRLENTGESVDQKLGPLKRYMGSLKQVRKLAPKTLHAVQTMPKVLTDELQSKVLRDEM